MSNALRRHRRSINGSAASTFPQQAYQALEEDAARVYVEAKEKVGTSGFTLPFCNFFIKRLVDGNRVDCARAFFHRMKTFGPPPNVNTYTITMDLWTRAGGSLDEADELLADMAANGVRPNQVAYATYIRGLCRAGHAESAWETFSVA